MAEPKKVWLFPPAAPEEVKKAVTLAESLAAMVFKSQPIPTTRERVMGSQSVWGDTRHCELCWRCGSPRKPYVCSTCESHAGFRCCEVCCSKCRGECDGNNCVTCGRSLVEGGCCTQKKAC